jgi:hypothetical protein
VLKPGKQPTRRLPQLQANTPLELKMAMQELMREQKQSLLEQVAYQAMLKKQFEQLMRDQAKVNEILQPIVRKLAYAEPATIATMLQDSDPWVRFVAIHVAAKKWLPLEQELIELLNDSYPGVSDAARQALVRLSRGNDFGPLATAKPLQVRQAQEQWQAWLALQVATRQPASYHD